MPSGSQRGVGVAADLKRRLREHNTGVASSSDEKAEAFERYLKSGSGRAFASKRLWQIRSARAKMSRRRRRSKLVMFAIEDEAHSEPQEGRFQTRQQAIAELRRRAAIPWNEAPNRAPCINWVNCGRRYELVEYDDAVSPWKELSRDLMLDISAAGVRWVTSE